MPKKLALFVLLGSAPTFIAAETGNATAREIQRKLANIDGPGPDNIPLGDGAVEPTHKTNVRIWSRVAKSDCIWY